LKNEIAEGGTLVSVYSPDDAMLWLEAHYDDPPLTSMRLLGVGGPIAMLSPDEPSLVILGQSMIILFSQLQEGFPSCLGSLS
jgi:hypothetical protein